MVAAAVAAVAEEEQEEAEGQNKFYKRSSEALHTCLNFRGMIVGRDGWLMNETPQRRARRRSARD